jgi:hypothetical protein
MGNDEVDLLRGVVDARAVLVQRTNEFTAMLRETLDPMKPVRRNPIGGIVASMATGLILGAGPAPPARRDAPRREAVAPSKLGGLLWGSLSLLAPILHEFAMRWASGRNPRRE